MPAAEVNIVVEQGATFTLSMVWRAKLTGLPISLVGWVARMQIRRNYKSSEKLLDLTTENGGITLGGVDGTIAVVATADQTAGIPARPAVYDLEIEDTTTGVVKRLLKGSVTISPEVTR